MEHLAGNLLQGLILGAFYGVATMGLSLIFGVLKIVNVGHGAFMMLGAYATLVLFRDLGIPPPLAFPIAGVLGMALGYFLYRLVVRRLLGATELATLIATFSFGVILEELVKWGFGAEVLGYQWEIGRLDLGITVVTWPRFIAFGASILVAAALYLWFTRTRAGTAIRSVVEDPRGARVCGVDVDRQYAVAFSLGIGLTVAGGVLMALFIPSGIHPYMGTGYTLKAFVIAVLGGLASPYGAFFGGVIFGLLENGSYTLLAEIPGAEPFALTRFFAFAMLLLILLVRPTGLLRSK